MTPFSFIDLHSHLKLITQPTPLFCERFLGHELSLKVIVNKLKSQNKKAIICVALYNIPPFQVGVNGLKKSISKFMHEREFLEYPDDVKIITKAKDLDDEFTLGIVWTLESCRWFSDPETLNELYELGIRGVTPMHFLHNSFGDSCNVPGFNIFGNKNKTLSPKGEKLLQKCIDLGIWIDGSHMSDATLSKALEVTKGKIIFTHIGLRDFTKSYRNVLFTNLKFLKETKGLFGICPYRQFTENEDVFEKQLSYLISNGYQDHISIGSDYGAPITSPKSLSNYFSLIQSIDNMSFSNENKEKLKWKNALDYLRTHLPD